MQTISNDDLKIVAGGVAVELAVKGPSKLPGKNPGLAPKKELAGGKLAV